jgi:hypothetical protein
MKLPCPCRHDPIFVGPEADGCTGEDCMPKLKPHGKLAKTYHAWRGDNCNGDSSKECEDTRASASQHCSRKFANMVTYPRRGDTWGRTRSKMTLKASLIEQLVRTTLLGSKLFPTWRQSATHPEQRVKSIYSALFSQQIHRSEFLLIAYNELGRYSSASTAAGPLPQGMHTSAALLFWPEARR